jgi:hypothetical protein
MLQSADWSINVSILKEFQGALPFSQEHTIIPYTEPDESNPIPHALFFKLFYYSLLM